MKLPSLFCDVFVSKVYKLNTNYAIKFHEVFLEETFADCPSKDVS